MPRVLLVTSEGCKPCSRVKRVLGELQSMMPTLTVETIDLASAEGAKLAVENGILYPPAVFIEGRLFGKGKIDSERMTESIREMGRVHD